MSLDIEFLIEKVRRMDRDALLRLQKILNDPQWLEAIRYPTDEISKGISEGAREYRHRLSLKPYAGTLKEKLHSQSVFHEIELLDRVESKVRCNVESLRRAIDDRLIASTA